VLIKNTKYLRVNKKALCMDEDDDGEGKGWENLESRKRKINNDKEGKLILNGEKLEAATLYHLQYPSQSLLAPIQTKPNTKHITFDSCNLATTILFKLFQSPIKPKKPSKHKNKRQTHTKVKAQQQCLTLCTNTSKVPLSNQNVLIRVLSLPALATGDRYPPELR